LTARHVRTVERHDLAFLRVETKDLVPIPWAESQHLEIGRWVVMPGPAGDLRGVGVIGVAEFSVPLEIPELGTRFGTDTTAPAKVRALTAPDPANGVGLRPEDTITAVDEQKTPTLGDLLRQLNSRSEAAKVQLRVMRGGESLDIEVQLTAPSGPRIVRRGPGGGARVVIVTPRASRAAASERQSGFPRVFQHDALVRPSDCGSPLVGLDGKAFGINIARVSGPAAYGLPAQIIIQEIDRLSDTKSGGEP
jgi:S1-C subfamily serine protease